MKIQRLTLENYRFFKEAQTFEFDGKNILLYGENGSGKSSLFYALQKLFRYYQDQDGAKENIKAAQNIFVSDRDIEKPKITIKIDDKTIVFDESGLDDDSMQAPIENTGKSKLFLTYKDVYAINAIFKEGLTYKEFKNIFIALYHDDVSGLFNELDMLIFEIEQHIADNRDFAIGSLKQLKNNLQSFSVNWDEELKPEINNNNSAQSVETYETAYYISEDYLIEITEYVKDLELLGNFESVFKALDILFDVLDIGANLLNIVEQAEPYVLSKDRYADKVDASELIIINREEVGGNSPLHDIKKNLESLHDFVQPFRDLSELSVKINDTINNKLQASRTAINNILRYLKENIIVEMPTRVDFIVPDYDFLYKEKVNKVYIKLTFAGKKLDNHSQNLNEAKMSALNTAIYFASVMEKKPDIPILVLDDLMISLDMSNRAKMLDFLLDKSNFDDDYQIFIFTHDRAFFELIRRRIERDGGWLVYEMYEDSSGAIPKPMLLSASDYLEKANEYFRLCDYPAAGNYLRKASEDVLKEKLLASYLGEIEKPTLAPMIQMYKKMCTDFGINIPKTIPLLEELAKRVFNPSSHDDLVSPLYKKEIYDAIRLVRIIKKRLPKIEKIDTTIKNGCELEFKYDGKYEAKYVFLGDIYLYKYGNEIKNRDKVLVANCGYKMLDGSSVWQEKHHKCNTSSLKDNFKRAQKFIKDKYSVDIGEDDFISGLSIAETPLDEDIKELVKKQIS